MNEYRVVWVKYPTAYNDKRVLFVEANSVEDARTLAIAYIERRIGLSRQDCQIGTPTLAEPLPAGNVK